MSQQSQQVFSGRYEILRHVARGGMAEVYLARDLMLDRRVALKVLFPELSTDRSFVERFRREAQAAANLSHPNIVGVYDWGEEEGTYFIVMEYVEGRTLSQIIRNEGPLLADRAADIGSEVAAALAFAHRNGVIHRDVKPGNVLISTTGQVKVTDFGIARAANTDQDLTQTGSVMGTATYFSPEQAQGHRVDQRSDVYSLGVMLYEMVVGRPPFQGDNPMAIALQHVRDQPIPPRQVNPDVPPQFEAIVLQAIAKNPNDRYMSADELRQDLQRFRQGRAVYANPTVVAPIVDDRTIAAPAYDATQRVDRTQVTGVATPEPEPKRSTAAFVVLLIVMLGVLAGLLWLVAREAGFIGEETPDRVQMPTVIGKPAEAATKELEDLGLDVQVDNQVTDAQPPGVVFDQDPKPGAPVDKGAAVTIRVSAEPEKVEVPDVVGKDFEEAESILTDAGFNVARKDVADDKVEEGKVVAQNPAKGTMLEKGETVEVSVSSGKPMVEVPDVTNMDATAAANRLGRAGFDVKRASEASDTIEAGRVIRTEPAAGEQAAEGSTVTMYVSSGPEKVRVPNVIGLTEAQAKDEIEAAGLVYAKGRTVPSNASDDGKVVAQNPSGGTMADKGSTVTVAVGQAVVGGTTTTTGGSS